MLSTKIQKTVLVLLSTFNGEKWLREQIESILSQKDVSVILLIRDDGSTDNTSQVVLKFREQISKMEDQTHLGFNQSYLKLMLESKKYEFDYIAFSDQDDIWDENKLIQAINLINSSGKNHYSSRRFIFSNDDRQNINQIIPERPVKALSYNFLVENVAPGCTTVLTRDFFLNEIVNRLSLMLIEYDYFIYMLAAITDNCCFDSDSRIRYRLHNSNAIGIGKQKQRSIDEVIHRLRSRKLQASLLLDTIQNLPQNVKALAIFLNSHSIFHKLLFVLRCGQLRQSKFEDLLTKFLLILI
jgi:glycosyltransferase involved in cell wall biosynthesis